MTHEKTKTVKNKSDSPKKKGRAGKVVSIILATLVLVLVALQVIGQATAKSNYGVMRYGNYQALRVLTDSMDPTYKVDTMVFVKRVDPKTLKGPSSEGALDGDVITFVRNYNGSYDLPGDKRIVTHRIQRVEVQEDGSVYFRTLGDNIHAKECPASGCTLEARGDWVRDTDILGKVVGQSMVLGKFSKLLANPIFIFVFALVPLLLVFGSSLKDLLKELKREGGGGDHTGQSDQEAEFARIKEQEKLRLLVELEKEKMREELKEDKNDETKEL